MCIFSNKMYMTFATFKSKTASKTLYNRRDIKAASSKFKAIIFQSGKGFMKCERRGVHVLASGMTAKQNLVMTIPYHFAK